MGITDEYNIELLIYKNRFLERVPLHWLELNTFDKNGN
jgi:hypothetical protein